MRFTKHAQDKMQLFGLPEDEILEGIEHPELVCEDLDRGSTVYIFRRSGKLYSIVVKEGAVITIYRTDEKRLSSRRRSGRWNCY